MSGLIYRCGSLHSSRRGFAVGAILYTLGLIGVLSGILFSSYIQIMHSSNTLQNGLLVKNDLQGASNTLSAEAIFGSDNQTLCVPRSTHQTSGDICAAAPVSLVQFGDLASTTQLPANYAAASSSGSPVEVGVFAVGSGVKQLDASGHYYIYCRWENTRANPASPAFVLISAGDNGILETKCGDTAAKGDDTFVFMTVGNVINRASLWQADSSNNVSYGSAGSKVTVDSSGDLTAAGTISAANAVITNGIISSTVTTSGDVSVKDLTASGNVIGTAGSFTSLSGGTLTLSDTATINGTTTLQALSAQAATLNSLTVSNGATIGSGMTVNGGDLVIADTYSFAQLDSTGVARRLIAMSPENDVLLGGHNGTQNIYFLTDNATVGYFDIEGNFTAIGTITGANGSFSSGSFTNLTTTNLTVANATVTGTLTVNNIAMTGTTSAATGNYTTVNAANIAASNNITVGNTLSAHSISATNISGSVTGASASFTSLSVINATISGTVTAGTGMFTSDNVIGSEVIGGTLSVMGGDLTIANDNSFAQYDNSGNARRLMALDSNNDLLIGGKSGTQTITFYANGSQAAVIDTSGDLTASGTVSGAAGSFASLTGGSLTVNHTGIVSGSLGIATATPQATLDVNGFMRLSKNTSQPATCSSSNDGAIALTALYTLCICKSGTGWVTETTGTTSCNW